MDERIRKELELLRQSYPDLEYIEEGQWVRIPAYPLPKGWNRSQTDVSFQIKAEHPDTPPYGFYTPIGLEYNDIKPNNYTEPAPTKPPFSGAWGIFSWQPLDGHWRPTADLQTGSNLRNWAMGFKDRFLEGV